MSQHALFINDAETALQALSKLDLSPTSQVQLVACAPHLTQRIGKWVAHSQREKWRAQWAAKLFEAVLPALEGKATVSTSIAKEALPRVVSQLRSRLGAELQVHDARRTPVGAAVEPLAATAPAAAGGRWVAPVAIASGLSVVLALVD